MDTFTIGQVQQIIASLYDEKLEYMKLQAGLVWVAANGKLDQVGKKKPTQVTDIDKLKNIGILEVE